MYTRIEKTKENNNREVANSVSQKKSNMKQMLGFADNRPEIVAQQKIQRLINNSSQAKQEIQPQTQVVANKSIQRMRAYDNAEPLTDPRHFSTTAIKAAIDNCRINGTAIPSWLKEQVSSYLRDELLERWQNMQLYNGGDAGHQYYFDLVQDYVHLVESMDEVGDSVPSSGPALQLRNDENIGQRKQQGITGISKQIDSVAVLQKKSNDIVIQRKYDHLFNDIPKTLLNIPQSLKSETIKKIRYALNSLRDDHSNGVDNLHAGEDQNASDFGLAQRSFLTAAEAYSHSLIGTSAMREATFSLWKYSVDSDVASALGNVSENVKQWHSFEKQTWEAIAKHTSIGE